MTFAGVPVLTIVCNNCYWSDDLRSKRNLPPYWRSAFTIASALGLVSMLSANSSASIGLGEWTIETPGKNQIAKTDQLGKRGVCLHRPFKNGQLEEKDVLVTQIRWWSYGQKHVVGKAKKGYFVFDEKSASTQFYKRHKEFDAATKALKIDAAEGSRLTAQDGWNIGVGKPLMEIYQKQIEELKKGTGQFKKLDPSERESLRKTLEPALKQLELQINGKPRKRNPAQEKRRKPQSTSGPRSAKNTDP